MAGAKLASEEKKPDGFFVIPDKKSFYDLIHLRNVGEIRGIGLKTAERLKKWGIITVDDLLNTPPQVLATFGKHGEEILKLARGDDDRQIVPDGVSKSIGREHTFQENIDDKEIMKAVLLLLSKDVSLRAKRKNLYGKTVTLKVKFHNMSSITRSKTGTATNSSKEIYAVVCELLDSLRFTEEVRLVGVTLAGLTDEKDDPDYQLSLFDNTEKDILNQQKTDALENTIFKLHSKYGRNILKTGKELEAGKILDEIE
jgi:DNA polymerase-4/DNA polymerase IV (DinB-like DNA polymerase)